LKINVPDNPDTTREALIMSWSNRKKNWARAFYCMTACLVFMAGHAAVLKFGLITDELPRLGLLIAVVAIVAALVLQAMRHIDAACDDLPPPPLWFAQKK
jgi:hypothetical protein